MNPVLLGGLICVLVCDALAHRLDEYLQAALISVATNRIDFSLELVPGVAVADQLLVVIDKNHDGQISTVEGNAYAQRVLSDVHARLDEKQLALSGGDISFPALGEVKAGVGAIRIKATAKIGQLSAGNHALSLTNAHLPAVSVYLVNALVPKDPAIQITKQTRDELQSYYRLEFAVSSSTR